jgi:hypothetical protein
VGDNDHGATLELRLQQVHHIVPRSQGRWARSTWRQVRSKETASTIRSGVDHQSILPPTPTVLSYLGLNASATWFRPLSRSTRSTSSAVTSARSAFSSRVLFLNLGCWGVGKHFPPLSTSTK